MRHLLAALAAILFASPAFADSLVHAIPTNAASPVASGSCIYVDQGPGTDTKLCSGFAAAFGAAASNATLTLGSSTLTLGATTSTVAGLTLTSPTINGGTMGAATAWTITSGTPTSYVGLDASSHMVTGSLAGFGNMTGSGATTSGNVLASNNTGALLNTAVDTGVAMSAIATLTGAQTLTNKTLTTPTINGAALSGTLSGNPTLSGVPIFSGLSSGTCANNVALDAGNHLIETGCSSITVPLTIPNGGTGNTALALTNPTPTYNLTGAMLSSNGTLISPMTTTTSTIGTFGGPAIAIIGTVPATSQSAIELVSAGGGTLAAPTATQSGQMIGTVRANGFGATNWGSSTRAALRFNAAENWTDTAQGTNITLRVTPTGGVATADEVTIAGLTTTIANTLVLTGTTSGPQSSCLGLNASNQVTLSSGACGTGAGGAGTVTSVGLGPGLTTTVGTQNPGTNAITTTGTVNLQSWPVLVTASCTVNTNCNGSITDESGEFIIINAAGVSLTLPNPAAGTKGKSYAFGSNGTNTFTLLTAGGTANFTGCATVGAGATSLVEAADIDVIVTDTGTAYKCTEAGGRTQFSTISWGPGQNLSTVAIPFSNVPTTRTILGITCTPETLIGGTATISVYKAASATALASGTNLTDTTNCNANTAATTDQTLATATPANWTVVGGNRIGIVAAGAGWASSAGSGVITVVWR